MERQPQKKRGRYEAIKEIAGRLLLKNYTNNSQVEGKINCYEPPHHSTTEHL
jgi:hypothetical protein